MSSITSSSILGPNALSSDNGIARYLSIAESLRRDILSGERPVGSRLPSERALARHFDVAHMTVRQALSVLEDAALVERCHGRGTFVRATAKAITIGLVFGPSLTDESAYFYRSALAALRQGASERDWLCRSYDSLTDLSGNPRGPECESLQQLGRDVERGDLQGIVEFSPGISGLSYDDAARPLPKARYEPGIKGSDSVLDTYRFGHEAITQLVKQGCERVAYLRTSRLAVNGTAPCSKDLDGMFDAVRELGIPVPQVENIVLSESFAHRGAEILARTQALVRGWRKKKPSLRPQALVVSDDISMRMVAMALVQSRVEIPGDLTVVCLTNEMAELHYGIPVVRYEMPIRRLASDLLDALQLRLNGKTPAPRLVAGSFHLSEISTPSLVSH